jgi:hypothetical protein
MRKSMLLDARQREEFFTFAMDLSPMDTGSFFLSMALW